MDGLSMSEHLSLDALALLDRALAAIDADPSTWIQSTWACRTGGCIAGHIARLVTGKFWPELAETDHDIREIAMGALGLTDVPDLFDVANSRRDLQIQRNILAGIDNGGKMAQS
jgi:hypothetical protein